MAGLRRAGACLLLTLCCVFFADSASWADGATDPAASASVSPSDSPASPSSASPADAASSEPSPSEPASSPAPSPSDVPTDMPVDEGGVTVMQLDPDQYAGLLAAGAFLVALVAALLFVQIGSRS